MAERPDRPDIHPQPNPVDHESNSWSWLVVAAGTGGILLVFLALVIRGGGLFAEDFGVLGYVVGGLLLVIGGFFLAVGLQRSMWVVFYGVSLVLFGLVALLGLGGWCILGLRGDCP